MGDYMVDVDAAEVIRVIANIIEGYKEDQDVMDLYVRLENLEKFLLTIE